MQDSCLSHLHTSHPLEAFCDAPGYGAHSLSGLSFSTHNSAMQTVSGVIGHVLTQA